jgi:hypothetical protein
MRTAKIEIEIACTADNAYFEDDIPERVVQELRLNGPIPCEGAGPGLWCDGCRFCAKFENCHQE